MIWSGSLGNKQCLRLSKLVSISLPSFPWDAQFKGTSPSIVQFETNLIIYREIVALQCELLPMYSGGFDFNLFFFRRHHLGTLPSEIKIVFLYNFFFTRLSLSPLRFYCFGFLVIIKKRNQRSGKIILNDDARFRWKLVFRFREKV